MKRGHIPVRACKGCGKKAPKKSLIRFVTEPGELKNDQNSGYGLYCCPEEACRERLQIRFKKQKLIRADKRRARE